MKSLAKELLELNRMGICTRGTETFACACKKCEGEFYRKLDETFPELKDDEEIILASFFMVSFTNIALDFSEYVFVNLQSLAGNRESLWDYIYQFRKQYCDVAIWNKTHAAPMISERGMNSQFEFVFIFTKNHPSRAIRTAPKWRGKVSNVLDLSPNSPKGDFATFHGAVFPIAFCGHFIEKFTQKDKIIVDPFIGSGSTMIAAEKSGRICYGMEIDPTYCDVTVERFEKLTGQKAKLLTKHA